MKILRIELNNLNSLRGKHVVDFTSEPLVDAGIFAITGPTGAGKSTILDALTLALYGRSARYGSDPNPEHVMSRHCGECSAEVEFEVPSGRYRAVWERRRARSRPDGALQPAKRYVYDEAGTVLSQQVREADAKIEELLGLNYDRFLRSALLAQGDFSKFLKSKADERAELLESLTGTEIYSHLGKLAHTEAGRRELEYRNQESRLSQIELMTEEDLEALLSEIRNGKVEYEQLRNQLEESEQRVVAIQQLHELRNKERQCRTAVESVLVQARENESLLAKLQRHRQTQPYADQLVSLKGSELRFAEAKAQQASAVRAYDHAVQAYQQRGVVLRAVVQSGIKGLSVQLEQTQSLIQRGQDKMSEFERWLQEHQHELALVENEGDIASSLSSLKSARSGMVQRWNEWKAIATRLSIAGSEGMLDDARVGSMDGLQAMTDAFVARAKQHIAGLKQACDKAKLDYQRRRSHFDKARLIASFETHRHQLKPGEECPLCGALEHPFANGMVKQGELDELEAEMNQAQRLEQQLQRQLIQVDGDVSRLAEGCEPLQRQLRALVAIEETVAAQMSPLGETLPVIGQEDVLAARLKERVKDYRATQKKLDQIKEAIQTEKTKYAAGVEKHASLLDKLANIEKLGIEVGAPEGGELPDLQVAESQLVAADRNLSAAKGKRAASQQALQEAEANDRTIRSALEEQVARSEFGDLQVLQQARLEHGEAERLDQLERRLSSQRIQATERLTQVEEGIQQLLQQQVMEGPEAVSYVEAHQQRKLQREQVFESLKGLELKHQQEQKNREAYDRLKRGLETVRQEVETWQRLKELIGSHDGSKFRKYAQSITLDMLIRHANRHLSQLSRRYQVRRDESELLNLQIEDMDQANAVRPMASLSGGESFLVSLALALGLSDLAGRTVRIDSLFIDEGFGSLDPETLEVAITALESLRQKQKTVGVISHVELLKERIATQICVEKKAGGVSQIRVTSSFTMSQP